MGMDMGLAAGLACVARTAQSRQQATQTSTRWQPLSGTASYGHDCKRHNFLLPISPSATHASEVLQQALKPVNHCQHGDEMHFYTRRHLLSEISHGQVEEGLP